MPEVQRISPENAREKQQRNEALLVCAYEDEDKCRKMHLEGALTLNELQKQVADLPREKEIVFYCA